MADITVSITEAAQLTTSTGFGLALVVDTTKDLDYKEYDISENLTAVTTDFETTTETYKIINTFASQTPRPTKIAVFAKDLTSSTTKPADLATALNTLITTNNNWYRIILEDKTEPLITAVSSWAETNNKIFYTEFANTTFTGDFTSKSRTVLGYKEGTDRLDAAMAGYAATRIPGSFTFKFKSFGNITADALTPVKITAAQGKKMNCYYKKFEVQGIGSAQLDNGVVANGKYIDQIESRDWISFKIQEEIAKVLVDSEKIPYDDNGISQIVACIETALNAAFDNKIITSKKDKTPAFSIEYKNLDQIPAADKTARKLTGITFKYIEAGAIHSVEVTGSVVVNL